MSDKAACDAVWRQLAKQGHMLQLMTSAFDELMAIELLQAPGFGERNVLANLIKRGGLVEVCSPADFTAYILTLRAAVARSAGLEEERAFVSSVFRGRLQETWLGGIATMGSEDSLLLFSSESLLTCTLRKVTEVAAKDPSASGALVAAAEILAVQLLPFHSSMLRHHLQTRGFAWMHSALAASALQTCGAISALAAHVGWGEVGGPLNLSFVNAALLLAAAVQWLAGTPEAYAQVVASAAPVAAQLCADCTAGMARKAGAAGSAGGCTPAEHLLAMAAAALGVAGAGQQLPATDEHGQDLREACMRFLPLAHRLMGQAEGAEVGAEVGPAMGASSSGAQSASAGSSGGTQLQPSGGEGREGEPQQQGLAELQQRLERLWGQRGTGRGTSKGKGRNGPDLEAVCWLQWEVVHGRLQAGEQGCFNPLCTSRLGPGAKLRKCTGCRVARYCSGECSTQAWGLVHKRTCKKLGGAGQ